jgi:hypothetical protein
MGKLIFRYFGLGILFLTVFSSSHAQGPQQMFWALNTNGVYLLDQVGSADASVAYSVRKLRRSYIGYAMKVRQDRPSGVDPEGDVDFDANGEVSASSQVTITLVGGSSYTLGSKVSLSSFYASYPVYVVTWYDQSGFGRNVTQSTASQQPRLATAGTLEVVNSKAAVRFINANSTVLTASIPSATMFGSGYIGTAALVLVATSGNTSAFGYSDGGSDRWQAHMNESTNLYFDVGNSYNRLNYANGANANVLRNYVLLAGIGKMRIYVSGTLAASSTPTMSASTTGTFYVGGIPPFPGTWYHNSHESELIIFPIELPAADLALIQASQKKFFGTP